MIKIEEFKNYLKIDKLDLDEEIIRHPQLLYEVSDALEEALAERDELKDKLNELEALLDYEIREDMKNEKLTEARIKNLILDDGRRKKLAEKLREAKYQVGKISALHKSFEDRGYRLRDLCSLYVSNYFTETSVRSDAIQDTTVYNRRRSRLAEARQSRENRLNAKERKKDLSVPKA